MNVDKIVISIIVFVLAFNANAKSSPSDEAQAFFAKGDYLSGMNILTKAMNDPDPVQRSLALEAYAKFYENIVGNTDYALSLYGQVIRTNLPPDHPIKTSVQKEIDRLNLLKAQNSKEDTFLRRLKPAELLSNETEKKERIAQLRSLIEQKPGYYRLSEVYYQLGRGYYAMENCHDAYLALRKSVELKPGVNYYLPVNVWADMAYGRWVRSTLYSILWGIFGGLLIVTAVAFYASRPWRWLKLRHLMIGLAMVALWLGVFAISYKWFTDNFPITDKVMFQVNAAPPYFTNFGPDSPNWEIVKSLFGYGLVGVLGLFALSVGIGRIKYRWTALLINLICALVLFGSLLTVFYMRYCDQKSIFNSEAKQTVLYYLQGGNYFVSTGLEPFVLTNPRAYRDLALSNVTDAYMGAWILKHCPFSPPASTPGSAEK
jgi:tetratricopeptide (TPR) repeat protein